MTGSSDGLIRIWDMKDGLKISTLKGHQYEVKKHIFVR
jgi:WD40 repeat protein